MQVQVDFDDKTSWEYLFKMYWVYLKDKLSLTLSELTQAKKPWKAVAAVVCKPQLTNAHLIALGGEVSISYSSSERMVLNKPCEEISFPQDDRLKNATSVIDNHVETINSAKEEGASSYYNATVAPSVKRGTDEPGIDKTTDKPGMEKDGNNPRIVRDTDKPNIDKDGNNPSIVEDTDKPNIEKDGNKPSIEKDRNNPVIMEKTDKPGICENRDEPVDNDSDKPGIGTEWASKDLLEFVAHMKNGDTSALSQLDVQMLLLEYIKRNNLRDPRRKSQIICDLRLQNLFGKARVGHIEMLKLLEFHFLMKEDGQKNSFIPAGFVGPAASVMEIDGNNYGSSMLMKGRKRKTRKKSEEKAPQNNLNEYAAIDFHNINLIYLRRNLMEKLIEDKENFNDKAVGSIVRIRISSNDQTPDIYRLVQVVGTSKVAEPYKIGDRTTDIMLEVLNLDKKEVVSIEAISNQEFTEDECRRLRQSIRCGLVKQFIVGEVQKKAMALQPVRLNDVSSSLTIFTLREYVDKLQLLKSPEERHRRINEVPVIHADPKMNPKYESEEDIRSSSISSKKDKYSRPSYSGRTPKPIAPDKKGKEESCNLAQNRMILEKHLNDVTNSAIGGGNDQAMPNSGLETSVPAASPSAYIIETEKLWHYRDPNGKIQGPFSMMQLRKWSTTGLFPPEMRIWTNHEQYDSLLLTDALNGKFHGAPELPHNSSSDLQERHATGTIERSEAINGTYRDSKQTEAGALCNHASNLSDSATELVRAVESGSSSWPQCLDFLKQNNPSAEDVQTYVAPSDQGHECVDDNHASQNGENNSIGPTQRDMTSEHDHQNQSNNLAQAPLSSEINVSSLPIDLSSNDKESLSVFTPESKSGVTIKQDGNIDIPDLSSPTPNSSNKQQSENGKESESVFASESKSDDTIKQDGNIDIPDPSSPTPNSSNKQQPESLDVGIQSSGILELLSLTPDRSNKQHSESSDVGIQSSNILELLSLSPTPRSNTEDQVVQATETKQSGLIDFLVPDSGPSWSSVASSLANSAQLPEVASEWCGYSPTPTKPPIQEWESGLASESSMRPPEVTNENVATSQSALPSWLAMLNEPIEFDALGEESVSDLLAEVETMESQGGFPSPTSAMKFAKEFIQDCNNDCFSSIEDFNATHDPVRSDAFSSTREVQLNSGSSVPCKPNEAAPMHPFDFFMRSSIHSSASSEGETNAPVYSGEAGSEFNPPDMVAATTVAPGTGSEAMDPGWGSVQGNINLVTVQGNVNLVLGPGQGMANLFGTNPGTGWANPNLNHSQMNVSLPWDGQRKYGGDRFTSPREWPYQGRPPWARQQYGGGGYPRPPPKGQRVCKFYESGRCKKGAFCDYLHP
ncbi:hypothetical protein RD792_008661 [Penstemon davidsonii]|uniref:Zinc finger CCCH domain-containing protein 44 n=1 Tax=Penstemon davidsonii TaxID=160366 RepID=A0ABR0D9Q7_9LAMI|nr:hypothetical protein RD792_008661 [Penstemon davidsonii]